MPEREAIHIILEDADIEKFNWLRAYLAGGGYGASKRAFVLCVRYLYRILNRGQMTIDEVFRTANDLNGGA